jgi:hypothetical protein
MGQLDAVPGHGRAQIHGPGECGRLLSLAVPIDGAFPGIGPQQVVQPVAAGCDRLEQVQIAELFEQRSRTALGQLDEPGHEVDGELVDLRDPELIENFRGLRLQRVRTADQLPHRQCETGPYAVVGATQLVEPVAFVGEQVGQMSEWPGRPGDQPPGRDPDREREVAAGIENGLGGHGFGVDPIGRGDAAEQLEAVGRGQHGEP